MFRRSISSIGHNRAITPAAKSLFCSTSKKFASLTPAASTQRTHQLSTLTTPLPSSSCRQLSYLSKQSSTLASSFTKRSYHHHESSHHQTQYTTTSNTSYVFGLVGAAGTTVAVLCVASDYLYSDSNIAYAQSTVDLNDASNIVLSNPLKSSPPVPSGSYSSPADVLRQQQLSAIDTLSSGDIIISPRWRRVIAGIIDSFVISAMSSVISYFFVGQLSPLQVPLMCIGNIIYECGSHIYFNGQTLGKMMLGLRVVKEDGTPMDIQTASILYATKLLNILFLSDYLWGLFNIHGDYKCLHNVFSKTVVALDK